MSHTRHQMTLPELLLELAKEYKEKDKDKPLIVMVPRDGGFDELAISGVSESNDHLKIWCYHLNPAVRAR